MSRLDIKVKLSDGIHDAELVSSGAKRSWVKLHHDKHVIKVRNHQLTIQLGDLHGLDKSILDSRGVPVGVANPRQAPPKAKLSNLSKNLHGGRFGG